MLLTLIFTLISAPVSAAPYTQTFDGTDAVPMTIAHYRNNGLSTDTWQASFVLLTTKQNVSWTMSCISNAFFKGQPQHYLSLATNYTRAFDEKQAKEYLNDFNDQDSCFDKLEKVLANPSHFRIVAVGKTATLQETKTGP